MYLTVEESVALATVVGHQNISSELQCVLLPPALSTYEVNKIVQGSGIAVGMQDVFWISKGAYTGAISAHMAKEAGAQYALVGHSERRYIFGEKDSDISKKIQACDEVGIIPVLCIGETKEDLDQGKRQYRLKKQLQEALAEKDFSLPLIIAYEPVWAITSATDSQPCAPVDAEDVVGFIKQELKQYTEAVIPVLYGGSVNVENAAQYAQMPSIDGLLVGSASTQKDSLVSLVQTLSQF